jgi:hypothetical protein
MECISRKDAIQKGLSKYYTGRPCSQGHVVERYTAGACVQCVSERKAELYQQNREKILAYMKVQGAIYRKNNPEKRAENSRKWKERNRTKVKELSRVRYAKNPEHRRAISRASYARRRDLEAQRMRMYRQTNKGIINFHTGKRKAARLQRTPAWLTLDDLWLIEQFYETAAERTKATGVQWHVDHKIPLQGKTVSGLHVPKNLQVILGVENSRKGNRVHHA